ncbi:MAG TPA: NAD(P)-dependent oxidoreductase [Actinomycetota bacterium]|jgi:D-3-phosphoglycerate dehydrogenase|nr:NAD(P)-dependent oxidoreductase [Actinomycetota bacterium]
MGPRLLVLDDYEGQIAGAPAMTRLRELAQVTVLDRPLADGDLDALTEVQVLLAIRERTQLDRQLLDRLPRLELVLQTGGHAYHVDEETATGRGIVVALGRRARMPSASVPELTFGLMLAVLRRIHPLAGQLAAGNWPEAMGGTLAGRTLGVLGLGRHGRPVARIAAAFGMLVLAWDRDPGRDYPDDEPVAERLPLDDLLERSDVVSVHLKLSSESDGLLDAGRLARMRPGAILINTARGAIVDEQALVAALAAGRLAGAGLDVFTTEPLPADHPLRAAPNVVLTPHIGWKVAEVFAEWAEIAAEQLAAWLAGRLPAGEVLNPAAAQVSRDRLGGLERE